MKVFVGYVSMSGNTEDMATILKDTLTAKGCEVTMESLEDVSAATILAYDFALIGAYTWGEGELPYEAEDFYEALTDLQLEDLYAGCFGSGDTNYEEYCAAVDLLANRLSESGCSVFENQLKIELGPETDEQVEECQQFALSVYEWVLANKEKVNV